MFLNKVEADLDQNFSGKSTESGSLIGQKKKNNNTEWRLKFWCLKVIGMPEGLECWKQHKIKIKLTQKTDYGLAKQV